MRGWLLAVSSAAVAISAHVAGGGELPDLSLTAILTVLVGWMATALADVARGPLGILVTLSAAQLVMHVLLSGLDEHQGSTVPLFGTAAMMAAHACAVAVTAFLVTHAERALLAFAASLLRLIPISWTTPRQPAPPTAPVRAADSPGTHVQVLLRRVCARRGPPLFA